MQTFNFTKMHGAGNDYIYVNCFSEKVEDINATAKLVSDRHFGIGSDGLVLICPSDVADFRMDMYNSDGTQAEMCGNATRCVGKYVHDRGLTDKTTVTLETLAGIKILNLNLNDKGEVETVCVNMGQPELNPKNIPIDSELDRFIQQPVEVDGKEYLVTGVSMGNPHAITYIDDVDNLEIEKIGPKFENHKMFPKRINTEFAQIVDRKTIKMRVWERGAGETLACGTGACATMVAANLSDLVDDEAELLLVGGTLKIKWDKKENNIYMTGPAAFVFDGTITLE
ncbi:MAG: diaminopimelate epimerase [Oscillospiraceae bacterium]|nr:diaminopimelate epimerase [Oscillospiraceae bacterium]